MTDVAESPLVELTWENYLSVLAQPGVVLVDCWASSCGACKILGPIFLNVAESHPHHTFAKLDTLVEDELTSALEIVHVPSLLLYKDGVLLFNQAGNFDEARLNDIIVQAMALDMDMVRADIARERQGAQDAERDGT